MKEQTNIVHQLKPLTDASSIQFRRRTIKYYSFFHFLSPSLSFIVCVCMHEHKYRHKWILNTTQSSKKKCCNQEREAAWNANKSTNNNNNNMKKSNLNKEQIKKNEKKERKKWKRTYTQPLSREKWHTGTLVECLLRRAQKQMNIVWQMYAYVVHYYLFICIRTFGMEIECAFLLMHHIVKGWCRIVTPF